MKTKIEPQYFARAFKSGGVWNLTIAPTNFAGAVPGLVSRSLEEVITVLSRNGATAEQITVLKENERLEDFIG